MRINKIDRPMFSLYLQDHNQTSSFKNPVQYLQIGGYDQRAVRFQNETTVFKSISSDKWELFIHNFSFGTQQNKNTASTVTFDPSVEFLFAPKDNFQEVAKMMRNMVPELQCDAYRCFFNTPCNSLKFKNRYSLYFDFEDAEQHKLRPKIESIKLFNSSKGDDPNKCYSTVVASDHLDHWVLGSVFLQTYYTIFDLSPRELYGFDYINIEIGRVNSTAQVQMYYDMYPADFKTVLAIGIGVSSLLILYLVIQVIRIYLMEHRKREIIFIVNHVDDEDFEERLLKSNR